VTDVQRLLADARAAGLVVTLDGDRVTYRGPRRLAPLADQLRQHEPVLRRLLAPTYPRPAARCCEAGRTACGRPGRLYPCGWRCIQHAPGVPQETP
jgi:hypothetical protein